MKFIVVSPGLPLNTWNIVQNTVSLCQHSGFYQNDAQFSQGRHFPSSTLAFSMPNKPTKHIHVS